MRLNSFYAASVLVLAALVTAIPGMAVADPVEFTFTTPTNLLDRHVSFLIGGTSIPNISIPAGTSAEGKRDKIVAAISANAVPKFTVEKVGTTGLRIKDLAKGTKVNFAPGLTGEEKDSEVAQNTIEGSIGFDNSVFASTDAFGNPSTFTGGVITNVGELSFSISANNLSDLNGSTITDALFDALVPQASAFGFTVINQGNILDFSFNPSFTTNQGGVVFGTTALSDGVFGSITVNVIPEPSSLFLLFFGIAGLSVASATKLRCRRMNNI